MAHKNIFARNCLNETTSHKWPKAYKQGSSFTVFREDVARGGGPLQGPILTLNLPCLLAAWKGKLTVLTEGVKFKAQGTAGQAEYPQQLEIALVQQLYKVFQQTPSPGEPKANTWLPQPGMYPKIIHFPRLIGK